MISNSEPATVPTRVRGPENPWPHARAAGDALREWTRLRLELAKLDAASQAARVAERAAWFTTAIAMFGLAFVFGCGWLLMAIHESGTSALHVAGLAVAAFGVPAVLCLALGFRRGRARENSEKPRSPFAAGEPPHAFHPEPSRSIPPTSPARAAGGTVPAGPN